MGFSDHLGSLMTWLFSTSVKAVVVVALILLVQFLFRKKLAAKWLYALWFLLIIRLITPFDIPSPTSIYNLLTTQHPVLVPNTTMLSTHAVHSHEPDLLFNPPPTQPRSSPAAMAKLTENKTLTRVQIISFLWLFIASLLGVTGLVVNIRTHRPASGRNPGRI
jgi:bla regulator protein BlaR1